MAERAAPAGRARSRLDVHVYLRGDLFVVRRAQENEKRDHANEEQTGEQERAFEHQDRRLLADEPLELS
jgi:hypothetical protein